MVAVFGLAIDLKKYGSGGGTRTPDTRIMISLFQRVYKYQSPLNTPSKYGCQSYHTAVANAV